MKKEDLLKMKRMVKFANLASFAVTMIFIVSTAYVIYIQNRMIRDGNRFQPPRGNGTKKVIRTQKREIAELKYKLLQMELERIVFKQQIKESKHTVNNYRNYILQSNKVKNAYFSTDDL